jgi:hypothetical protein
MTGVSYRAEVLDELLRHGVRPTPATPPPVVRAFLNDLYRFELRRLRDRLLSGAIRKPDYSFHVVELRRRYPLLSVPVVLWTE